MSSVLRPSSQRSSFLECVDAAKAGDRRGIDELIAECIPHITAYVARRGSTDPEALANLVALEFLRNLPRLEFGSDGQAWSYLYRIARSRLIDEHRRIGAQSKQSELIETDKPTSDFDQEVVDKIWVDDALDALTEEQRTVIELRFLKDLSIAETAERTGKSATAVKGLQRRALKQLAAVVAFVLLIAVAGISLRNGPAADLPQIQTGDSDDERGSQDERSIAGGDGIDAGGLTGTVPNSDSPNAQPGLSGAAADGAGPVLDAGSNLVVPFRSPVRLRPSFDGDPSSTTFRWTQYSGPEEATFAGDWSNTVVNFPQWGTYILTIVAESDGALIASDNIMVKVQSPLTVNETTVTTLPATSATTTSPSPSTTVPTTAGQSPTTTQPGAGAPTTPLPPVTNTTPPTTGGPVTSIGGGPPPTDNEAAGRPVIDESTLTSPNLVTNGGFEGGQAGGLGAFFASVNGWSTTDPSGLIEVWGSGTNGVNAPEGAQFIEVNGYEANTISQVVAVTPGTRYLVSYSHRGRSDSDQLELLVDGVGIGTHTSLGTWLRVQAIITVPANTHNITLGLRAVDSGSVGNFVDDVKVRSLD